MSEYNYRDGYDLHMEDVYGSELMIDDQQELEDKIIRLEVYDGKDSSEEFLMTTQQARTLMSKLQDLIQNAEHMND